MSVQFFQNVKGGFKRGAKYDVVGKDDKGNVLVALDKAKKVTAALPLNANKKFSVYEKLDLEIAKGDKIRITQNGFSKEKSALIMEIY